MALNSKIEWTEATWNPATGCTKISDGCANCYAERLAHRLKAMGNRRYANGFSLTLHHDLIDLPLKWREPKFVFVNSMSDLFHEQMPLSFIQSVFKTMEKADKHVFQILTKRSHRLLEVSDKIPWPSNVWMGVTVESQKYVDRISELQRVPAQTKFLSIEPLLSNIPELPLSGIDWVIVGGESGPRCRYRPNRLGPFHKGPMRQEGRALLLQTVGRNAKEGLRQVVGWKDLVRNAGSREHPIRSQAGLRIVAFTINHGHLL